jgi:hypothetical protein
MREFMEGAEAISRAAPDVVMLPIEVLEEAIWFGARAGIAAESLKTLEG